MAATKLRQEAAHAIVERLFRCSTDDEISVLLARMQHGIEGFREVLEVSCHTAITLKQAFASGRTPHPTLVTTSLQPHSVASLLHSKANPESLHLLDADLMVALCEAFPSVFLMGYVKALVGRVVMLQEDILTEFGHCDGSLSHDVWL